MKNAKEFKERMQEEEFAKLFSDAETDEEIINIAEEQGYKITKEDIQDFEMTDEMLESVAGGKMTAEIPDEKREISFNAYGNIAIYLD